MRLLANPLFQHPDPDVMSVQGWLNVRCPWFSLHAAVSIEDANRAGLRQIFQLLFLVCKIICESVVVKLLSTR